MDVIFKWIKYIIFHNKWNKSTKYCPKCGNKYLGEMRSSNLKFCTKCGHWFNWKLDENQKSLL